MKRQIVSALVFLIFFQCAVIAFAKQASPNDDAKQLVEAAAKAMGGIEKLRAIKSLQFDALGHWNRLEQSERPEGPWLVSYDSVSEMRDLEKQRLRQVAQGDGFSPFGKNKATMIIADNVAAIELNGRVIPFTMAQVQDAEEWLAFGPERILFTALEAKDLHLERDTVLQGVAHRVVAFTWKDSPVRLFLNAHTALPTAVESSRPHPFDIFWGIWGNFPSRTYFSFWTLERDGLRYPHQWDNERNGQSYRTLTITGIKFNVELPADAFQIGEEVKQAFALRGRMTINDLPLGLPNQQPQEIAKDVVQIRGRWNVTLIKQNDGIVILEAPISSGYAAKVIAEAEKRFPGVPIKAAISTSDAFPHFGGVREYVGRGIPLYILDLNQPIIKRLLDAPFRTSPDTLASKPRKADLRIVSQKTVIGKGDNRLELYPIRSESGERMMMVYAPQHRLLYGSDLVQKTGNSSFFMPQYLTELVSAVTREKLVVDKVFAMHGTQVNWSEINEAIGKASVR